MRRTVSSGLLLLGLACGAGAPGTDVRTRSGATQFEGKYAVFRQYDVWTSAAFEADGGATGVVPLTALDLLVMDVPWACATQSDAPYPADVALVYWAILRPKPQSPSTGSYPLGSKGPSGTGDVSLGEYTDVRPECLADAQEFAGGSLDISRLTESEAEGFIRVSLQDGTIIDGDFLAHRCPAVFPDFSDGGIPDPLPPCRG